MAPVCHRRHSRWCRKHAASLVGVIFMTVSLVGGAVSALVFHAKKKNLEKELDAEYGGKRHK